MTTVMSSTSQITYELPPLASLERHFSVTEIAKMWGVSEDMVRRLFEHEAGVLVLEPSRPTYGRRRYRTLRIPESVVDRVHKRHLVVSSKS